MELRRTWYTIFDAEDPRLVHQVWLPMDSTIEEFIIAIKQKHLHIDYDVSVCQYASAGRPQTCESLLLDCPNSLNEPLVVEHEGKKQRRFALTPQHLRRMCESLLDQTLEYLARMYELPEKSWTAVFMIARSYYPCSPVRHCYSGLRTIYGENEYQAREGLPLPDVDLPDIFLHHEWNFLEHTHRLCQTESGIGPGIYFYTNYLMRRCQDRLT